MLSKSVSGKSTSSDGEQERVCRLPANTVLIQDCDSACRKAADSFPPAVTAGCGRLLHSDNLAIQNAASSCETIHFSDQANEHSKSTVVSTSCVLVPKYCESLPTEEGNNHNEVCIVGCSEPSSIRRWHSSLRLFPRQPEDVTYLSGYFFGWQQSLSQRITGFTYPEEVKMHYQESFYWHKCR